MDVKEIVDENAKFVLNSDSIQRLILFVHNLEEKLISVKTIHENLYKLISIVSKTHEDIIQELTNIKNILNQQNLQTNSIDQTKFQWNEEDEQIRSTNLIEKFQSKSSTNLSSIDQQINSPSTHQTDRLSLYSPSSLNSSSTNSLTIENRPNSSTSKRSSNLKKLDQKSTRIKSPKSVTFHLEDNNNTINEIIPSSILPNSNELLRENSDLIPDLFKEHHQEVTNQPNIGFKLGNALTNVRIHEIESINGDYLRLLNISNSDDYDLTGHFLQQNISCVPISRFRFPFNTIIRAGQTITIWCGALRDIEAQPPHIFIWKEQTKWESGPECVTILAKPSGQAIAWARSSHRINTDQSSSDILFIHSKSNISTPDPTTISTNSLKNRCRLSPFHFIGNTKPPFAHSPSNPIHPDHNGIFSNKTNDLRSQIYQKGGISQLLNRPKSSPFSSHLGCKQDLISMNFLQKQQNKSTTLKT